MAENPATALEEAEPATAPASPEVSHAEAVAESISDGPTADAVSESVSEGVGAEPRPAAAVSEADATSDTPPELQPQESSGASPEGSPEVSPEDLPRDSPEAAASAAPEEPQHPSSASAVPAPATTAAPSAEATRSGHKAAKGRAALWRKVLLGKDASRANIAPFSEWKGELNEQNQRVIRVDCERTRADEPFFRQPEVRRKMEAMLTSWCQQQSVRYKQGMNEVLAPFIFLQTEPEKSAPSDDEVFACFSAFMRRFAPLFESEDFVALQCAFVFFRRLLLYHFPDLHHLLVDSGISPEMFCTPWFLTVFASKTPLRITLQLWDRHLERNEPSFFVFLAVAVLGSSQQAVHSCERSALPEILTTLGISSRSELERLWSAAEVVHRTTPATFAARLRRTVLGIRRGKGDKEGSVDDGRSRRDSTMELPDERLLERVEEERCFFILPEELVGHAYPPRSGEDRKPWHPSPMHSWRLIVLDLRSRAEFEEKRLPTALPFDILSLVAAQQGTSLQRKLGLLNWNQDGASSGLDPSRVFEALKSTLGEDWVCNPEAHICLLGTSEPPERAVLVRSLYEIMTMNLSLRHVSVASGGFEAVAACVKKNGFELVTMDGGSDMAGESPGHSEEGNSLTKRWSLARNSAAAHAGSVWSSLKKAASAAANKAGESVGNTAETNESTGDEASGGFLTSTTSTEGAPALRDRPGNWPMDIDLGTLPRRLCGELCAPNVHWPCIAVSVQCPSSSVSRPRLSSEIDGCEGCSSLLSMVGPQLVCAADPRGATEEVVIFAEFALSKVLRVTSKKQAPDTLIFYFKDAKAGSTASDAGTAAAAGAETDEPAMVLCFTRGANDVKSFIKALRGGYNHSSASATSGGGGQGNSTSAVPNSSGNTQQAEDVPANPGSGSNEGFAPPARSTSTEAGKQDPALDESATAIGEDQHSQ